MDNSEDNILCLYFMPVICILLVKLYILNTSSDRLLTFDCFCYFDNSVISDMGNIRPLL